MRRFQNLQVEMIHLHLGHQDLMAHGATQVVVMNPVVKDTLSLRRAIRKSW